MISAIKNFAPIALYVLGAVLFLASLCGKRKWTLLFVIFLLPLQNVLEKLHSLPMGKDFVDILIIGLLIGSFATVFSQKEKTVAKNPLTAIALVLICYTYISFFRGYGYLGYFAPFNFGDPRIQEWKNYCMLPILFFIMFNTIKDEKWLRRTFWVICFSMLIVNYYTTTQLTWFSSIASREKIDGTTVYLGPNEIAAFYNQYTMILLGVYFYIKKKLPKLFLLGLILVNFYCVLFLFSRAAYLATAAGLALLFFVKDKRLLILLIIGVICWQTMLPAKVQERIMMTVNQYGQLDASAEGRLILWQQSADLFKSSPIFGIGFGVFSHLGYSLGDTHNIYLKILVEQGMIGLFIFFVLILKFFAVGISLFKKATDGFPKGLGLGFCVALVTLLVNNMFGDRWTYTAISSNLWVFAALVARYNCIYSEKKAETEDAS